jgi:hypothetical protein
LHIVGDAAARRRRLERALEDVEDGITNLEQRGGEDARRTAEALRTLRRDLLTALRLTEE